MKTRVIVISLSVLFISSSTSTLSNATDTLNPPPSAPTGLSIGYVPKYDTRSSKSEVRHVDRTINPIIIERAPSALKRMPALLTQQIMLNMKKAQSSLVSGKAVEANSYFNKALQIAVTAEQKSEISMTWANVLSHEAKVKGRDPVLQQQAAEHYRKSLPNLRGESRLLGFNNYGSLLLRMNDSKHALRILASAKAPFTKEKNSKNQSRFLYNLARAYELNGDIMTANTNFLKTAQIDPSFSPASKAVIRTIPYLKASHVHILDTTKWLNAMIEKGDLSLAEKGLQTILAQRTWASQTGFQSIMLSLIRYLTVTTTGPRTFRSVWSNLLSISKLDSGIVKQIKKEIIRLYEGEFFIAFRSAINRNLIQALLSTEKEYGATGVVSEFIKMIGDSFVIDRQYKSALQRYALALDTDNKNMDAALGAATILLNHAEEIRDSKELTNQLISTLFHGKGEAYLGKDWENILRFHIVLGTIFKRLDRWGDSHDPYSAIFQFEHAITAYDRLVKQQPEGKWRIAGVKFALAGVYLSAAISRSHSPNFAAIGMNRFPTNTYVDAAKSAMIEKDRELAKHIVRALNEHHPTLNEKQQTIIRDVEHFVQTDRDT